jgi:hypothetical protein
MKASPTPSDELEPPLDVARRATAVRGFARAFDVVPARVPVLPLDVACLAM